jgi:COMPASS component SWD3
MANGHPDEGGLGTNATAGAEPSPEAVHGPLRLRNTLTGHTRAVSSLKFSPVDSSLLASASADRSVRVWRLSSSTSSESDPASSCADGVADAAGPREVSAPGGLQHTSGVNDVAWSPLGNYLASASDDTVVRLWDAETGACLREMEGHTNYAYCCQFDPAGRVLVSAEPLQTLGVSHCRGLSRPSGMPA